MTQCSEPHDAPQFEPHQLKLTDCPLASRLGLQVLLAVVVLSWSYVIYASRVASHWLLEKRTGLLQQDWTQVVLLTQVRVSALTRHQVNDFNKTATKYGFIVVTCCWFSLLMFNHCPLSLFWLRLTDCWNPPGLQTSSDLLDQVVGLDLPDLQKLPARQDLTWKHGNKQRSPSKQITAQRRECQTADTRNYGYNISAVALMCHVWLL